MKGNLNASRQHFDDKKFVEISEAWSVLSKPDSRRKYDEQLKVKAISSLPFGTVTDRYHPESSEAFSTQRNNFVSVQKNACSNWKDLKDKYKTEKWQAMPLETRKVLDIIFSLAFLFIANYVLF